MTSSLASRLEDIPGVASVVVDLESSGRGIDVRLESGADEATVMERLRTVLAAYGVRRGREPAMSLGWAEEPLAQSGVRVNITPVDTGARIEVATSSVRSFRIVSPTPLSIAQGLADAWCQVIGRVPVEIVAVSVDDASRLVITASDGEHETEGAVDVSGGWMEALTGAVAEALGESRSPDVSKAAS